MLEPLEPEFHCPPGVGGPVDLGRVEVISAGAITQNLLMVLVAEGSVSADVRVFDADTAALTNANRCPFVLIDRLGGAKVEAIAALVPRRIRVEPVPRHLDHDTDSLIGGGATIVVGADDVEARHRAQSRRPEWLGIGATSHFLVLVTEHPQGWACAGCAHAARGEDIAIIPTISIVSFWAGLLLALRLLAHASGRPYPAERQVTNFWPLRRGVAGCQGSPVPIGGASRAPTQAPFLLLFGRHPGRSARLPGVCGRTAGSRCPLLCGRRERLLKRRTSPFSARGARGRSVCFDSGRPARCGGSV